MSKLMRSILAPVEHGCVYIRDAESKEAHETWDPDASPVVWGTDFILFAVQPAVDGEVELEIWRGMPGEPLSAVLFDGVIYLSHGRMVAHDPNEDFRIEVPGLGHGGDLKILVDDIEFTAKAQVVLQF